jgi:hypothetical protein
MSTRKSANRKSVPEKSTPRKKSKYTPVKRSTRRNTARKSSAHRMHKNTNLPIKQQKFCSCVAHVAAKQPAKCNIDKAWFEKRDGKECYNPYAICASRVGTTSRTCGENFDYGQLSRQELIGLASLRGHKYTSSKTRSELIRKLQKK